MTEDGSGEVAPDGEVEEEEFAPTPFDGPYFLPVVLFGLAIWFGYDGWLNEAEHLQDDLWFNRVGALIWATAGAWFLYRARREDSGD